MPPIGKKCSIPHIFYSLKWAHLLIQITVSYTFCNLEVIYSAFSIWYFLADPCYLLNRLKVLLITMIEILFSHRMITLFKCRLENSQMMGSSNIYFPMGRTIEGFNNLDFNLTAIWTVSSEQLILVGC